MYQYFHIQYIWLSSGTGQSASGKDRLPRTIPSAISYASTVSSVTDMGNRLKAVYSVSRGSSWTSTTEDVGNSQSRQRDHTTIFVQTSLCDAYSLTSRAYAGIISKCNKQISNLKIMETLHVITYNETIRVQHLNQIRDNQEGTQCPTYISLPIPLYIIRGSRITEQ